MNRQVRFGMQATSLVMTLVMTVGLAFAQAPATTAPAGSSNSSNTSNSNAASNAASNAGGPVYVMKTAGQPERRVQVVRSEVQPDGSILTDVKDLASGTIYTLNNPAFLGKSPVAAAPAPTAAPVPPPASAPPTLAPGTPRPLFGYFPGQAPQAKPSTAQPSISKPFVPQSAVAQRDRLIPAEQPSSTGLPQARDRKADPLLAGANSAGASSPAAMTSRTPFPRLANMPTDPPSVLGKVFGDPLKNQPRPRVGTLPSESASSTTNTTSNVAIPKWKPDVTVVMPTVASAAVPTKKTSPTDLASHPTPPQPSVPTVATPASLPAQADTAIATGLAVPTIDPNAKPSAATGLFDSQSSVAAVAIPRIMDPVEPMVASAQSVALPPLAETRTAPVATPEPVASAPNTSAPKIDTPPAIGIPHTPSVVQAAPVAATSPAISVPSIPMIDGAATSTVPAPTSAVPAAELPRTILQKIEDLKTHKRPSFRMENATELAESPYAKHPTVIEALLHGAANDKTGVVRGHCITQLADIGYTDPTFLTLLGTWSQDREPAVQRAAIAAKAKLAGQ